jgi:hypothetical protein
MSSNESQRLRFGPESGEKPGGIGTVRFKVTCEDKSDDVLAKVKEVFEVVLSNFEKIPFPSDEAWRRVLPTWFVEQCARERTEVEDKEYIRWWDSLSWEQKQQETKKDKRWPLRNKKGGHCYLLCLMLDLLYCLHASARSTTGG